VVVVEGRGSRFDDIGTVDSVQECRAADLAEGYGGPRVDGEGVV